MYQLSLDLSQLIFLTMGESDPQWGQRQVYSWVSIKKLLHKY